MADTSHITIAYADCFSGVSGDMFLGALLDAGLPEEALRHELSLLDIGDFSLSVSSSPTDSIKAFRVGIESGDNRPHRSWKTIRTLLGESELSGPVKEKALAVFAALAKAEAHVHGITEDEVHFHEVGAIDAIIDVVGAAAGLTHLGIDRLISSPLPMPRGWVACEHGLLPVPAPAVCEILKGVPVYGVDLEAELVTPTGAALVKTLSQQFGPFPSMTISSVGYGAGSRELPGNRPNLLRLVVGQAARVDELQEVLVIETHLDDWQPEGFPYLAEQLFDTGALDVILAPVQMKKGRLGFALRVIAPPALGWELQRLVLTETTAAGLRYHTEKRWTLPREQGTIATRWGLLRVKRLQTPAGPILTPEYEDCRRLATEHRVPLREVYAEAGRCSPEDFSKDIERP